MSLKVIGAGLPRTGTVSLRVALQKLLGGHCYHGIEILKHPEHVPFWRQACAGQKVDWDEVLSGYIGSLDAPASLCWRELMQAYPDALVLLSYRDPRSWAVSCSNTIFFERCHTGVDQDRASDPTAGAALEDDPLGFIGQSFMEYMQIDFDPRRYEASAIRAFERHNAAVKAGVPAERLLLWQVKEGWDPICSALKLPVPNEPFPHANDARNYRRTMRYVGFAERLLGRRLTARLINSLSSRFGYG
jgi:hypothetical protein